MELLDRDSSKQRYGDPVFNQWHVAVDAYSSMITLLKLSPDGTTFTESDKECIKHGCEALAACVGQMDSGQRGKGVSFDEIPHVMARICVAAMRMVLSGTLDGITTIDE